VQNAQLTKDKKEKYN